MSGRGRGRGRGKPLMATSSGATLDPSTLTKLEGPPPMFPPLDLPVAEAVTCDREREKIKEARELRRLFRSSNGYGVIASTSWFVHDTAFPSGDMGCSPSSGSDPRDHRWAFVDHHLTDHGSAEDPTLNQRVTLMNQSLIRDDFLPAELNERSDARPNRRLGYRVHAADGWKKGALSLLDKAATLERKAGGTADQSAENADELHLNDYEEEDLEDDNDYVDNYFDNGEAYEESDGGDDEGATY